MVLFTSFPPRRLGFNPGPVPVGFMVDRVTLGQGFLLVYFGDHLSVSFHGCPIIIRLSPTLYGPSIWYRSLIMLIKVIVDVGLCGANSSRIRLTWPVRWSPGHTDFPLSEILAVLSTVCGPVKNDSYGTSVVARCVVSEDRMNAKFLVTGICTFSVRFVVHVDFTYWS